MNRFIPTILSCMLAWGLTSCQIYGVTNGIGQLPKEYRERLIETDAPIDSLMADGNIYIVSVDRIKEFLGAPAKPCV